MTRAAVVAADWNLKLLVAAVPGQRLPQGSAAEPRSVAPAILGETVFGNCMGKSPRLPDNWPVAEEPLDTCTTARAALVPFTMPVKCSGEMIVPLTDARVGVCSVEMAVHVAAQPKSTSFIVTVKPKVFVKLSNVPAGLSSSMMPAICV